MIKMSAENLPENAINIKDLKKESSRGSSRSRSRANKMRQVTMGIPGPGFR